MFITFFLVFGLVFGLVFVFGLFLVFLEDLYYAFFTQESVAVANVGCMIVRRLIAYKIRIGAEDHSLDI